ncbi:MAG: hypothetical protein ACRD0G_20145 [Acidimicrobiales bacterium]
MQKPALVAVVVVAALTLTGCTPDTRTGVGVDELGVPVLVTALCGGERVEEVVLRTNPLGDVEADRPDDIPQPEVLWRISSAEGSEIDHFTVGVEPPGFVTDVPLEAPVPNSSLAFAFDTNQFGEAVTFELGELGALRAGEVLHTGDVVEETHLREVADKGGRCGRDVFREVRQFGLVAGVSLFVLVGVGLLIAFATGGFDRRRRRAISPPPKSESKPPEPKSEVPS